MITKFRTAYKAGFSSGLLKETFSPYMEAAHYEFKDNTIGTGRLQRAFCRGWKDGHTEQRKERLEMRSRVIVSGVYVDENGYIKDGVAELIGSDRIAFLGRPVPPQIVSSEETDFDTPF